MKEYAEILEGDLTCDEMSSYVDYRKVHSLVGLRKVYQYIGSIEGEPLTESQIPTKIL